MFLMLYSVPFLTYMQFHGMGSNTVQMIILLGKNTIEKTHIYCCNCYTWERTGKRSPNVATRNELGRLPLNLQVSTNILKCRIHLEFTKFTKRQHTQSLFNNISNRSAEKNKREWSSLNLKDNTLCDNNNIDKTII